MGKIFDKKTSFDELKGYETFAPHLSPLHFSPPGYFATEQFRLRDISPPKFFPNIFWNKKQMKKLIVLKNNKESIILKMLSWSHEIMACNVTKNTSAFRREDQKSSD